MLVLKTIGLMAAVALAQDTDTTFAAEGATAIDLDNVAGEVVVRAWDRDEIRVQARHGRRTEIRIRRRQNSLRVSSEGRFAAGIADLDITVPRGFTVSAEGMFSGLDVEGVGGAVRAQSIEGSLRVVGGRGDIDLNSIKGRITVESSEGRIRISAIQQQVELTDVGGEVSVEAVSGSVSLRGMTASKVEAGTVSGSVFFEGVVADGGEYWLSTHSGRVTMEVPADTNGDFWAATVSGSTRIQMPDRRENLGRGSHEFQLGRGGADVELESFSGPVIVRTPGGGER